MTETAREHTPSPIQLGNLTIDLHNRRITRAGGNRVNLTRQEQRLLHALLAAHGSVLSYAELTRSLWGKVDGVSSSALRRCALSLRHKLGTPHLQTIYGVGYRLSEHIRPDTDASLEAPRRTP